jgi:CRISPR system Cascade subunit CasE
MIASALHLSRRDLAILKISDSYSVHRVVYDLFDDVRSDTDKLNNQSSGILYRDNGMDENGKSILILSNREPVNRSHGELFTKKIDDSLFDYSKYNFSIIINPITRIGSKVTPIRKESEICDWLVTKSADWGFSVDNNNISIDRITADQFTGKCGNHITLCRASISGLLSVTEPDKFKHSFKTGIGRAKSFGCGLLQIIPV